MTDRVAITSLLFSLLLASVGTAAELTTPLVTYWAGPGWGSRTLTERDAEQLKKANFDTVWAKTQEELDIAAKYGLKGICDLRVRKKREIVPLPEILARAERVKDHPALLMYYLWDEPDATLFRPLAAVADGIGTVDKVHPSWATLLPTYARNKDLGVTGTVEEAYCEYVSRFCREFKPRFLVYDHYQFNNGGDTQNYFLNIEVIRKNAERSGIPWINCVQACAWKQPGLDIASPNAPRIPNGDELRFLANTTAAFGGQGLCYFVYSHAMCRGAIAEVDGTVGRNYPEVTRINAEFVALVKELKACRFADAWVLGNCPNGLKSYEVRAGLNLEVDGGCAKTSDGYLPDSTLLTKFTSKDGADRFVVVNLDYRKDRTVGVSAETALERFDLSSGTWRSVGTLPYATKLGKGACVLLRQKR